MFVTTADEQDRAQVSEFAERVQLKTGETVEIAFVEQNYTCENAADAAEEHGIKLEMAPLPTAKRGFLLLPRRWGVERSFGWVSQFRRLARDYKRLPETLAELHFLAFAILMLKKIAEVLAKRLITSSKVSLPPPPDSAGASEERVMTTDHCDPHG
jgi:transposase